MNIYIYIALSPEEKGKMTDRELKKLSRSQLLEMLLAQSREVERLRSELQQARAALGKRQLQMEEFGNIAEASLKLNGVFESAQAAADEYLKNIAEASKRSQVYCQTLEEQTRANCEEMVRAAREESEAYWDSVRDKIQDPFLDSESWQEVLTMLDSKPGNRKKVRAWKTK